MTKAQSRRPTRQALEAGIRSQAGNLTRLAGALGVSRPTLYKWIYQLDLSTVAGVATIDGAYGSYTRNYVKPSPMEGVSLSDVEQSSTVADPRISTNVRIRDGVWRALRKLAIDRGTSASDLLERAAVEFLKKAESRQE